MVIMLDKIIQELQTRGYALIPSLLGDIDLAEINDFFEEHKTEFVPAKVGHQNHKLRLTEIRGDYTYWLDPLNPIGPFKKPLEFLEALREKLNSTFYLGLKQFECHLAFYPAGTFYKKHLDRFEKNSSRSLSFVFYLNQEWAEENHGELVLYDKQSKILDSIYPMPGTFICFLSEDFPHEVLSASKERRSLTGWMHSKIIY